MTLGERNSFNAALDKAKKLEWQMRVQRAVDRKLEPLGTAEAIKLLRDIEALL